VGILFVTALLTILGYSVNDTIVVYDRTRENLIYNPQDTFEATINKSVNETVGRSINTSLTTLLVLFALYFFGGATISQFVLALIIGTIAGSYSSIFIASPLLVVWQKMSKK
ncbi:protein translocase subunit SecF, partial [Patescibacteria group bacterium]